MIFVIFSQGHLFKVKVIRSSQYFTCRVSLDIKLLKVGGLFSTESISSSRLISSIVLIQWQIPDFPLPVGGTDLVGGAPPADTAKFENQSERIGTLEGGGGTGCALLGSAIVVGRRIV